MQTKLRSLLTIPVIAGAVLAGSSAVQAANIGMPQMPADPLTDYLTGSGIVTVKTLPSIPPGPPNPLFPFGHVDIIVNPGSTISDSGGAFSMFAPGSPIFFKDLTLVPPNPFPNPPKTYLTGAGLCAIGTNCTDPNPIIDLGGGNHFTAMDFTGPIFTAFPVGVGTTIAYRTSGMWWSGDGSVYNGSVLFSADFPGLTPVEVQAASLRPQGVTRAFSFTADISKKTTPEPSAVLGMVAIAGSALLMRRSKKVKS